MSDRPDPKRGVVPTADKALSRRSSALVRRGLDAIEKRQSSEGQNVGAQNSGKAERSEGKTRSVFEAMAEILEGKGSVAEVGPDSYADFVNLSDDTMAHVIACMIIDSEKELNRMLLDEERNYTDSELVGHFKTKLWLLSRGWLRFGDDGMLYMYKPQGPEPTPEMEQLLDDRINRAVPQIGPTLMDLVRKSVKGST